MVNVYTLAGNVLYSGNPVYNGAYMKPGCVEFRNVNVPEPIAWARGCYVDFPLTGMRYYMYSLPQPKRQARNASVGNAIAYGEVKFYTRAKDLEIFPFRDFVLDDNGIHFTTRDSVSTYENLSGISRRVQACLDFYAPGEWRVEVHGNLPKDLAEAIEEERDFEISGSLLDALDRCYDVWGVGWSYTVRGGKNVLTLAFAEAEQRDSEIDFEFKYGKGNGLLSLDRNLTNEDKYLTRLYAYGSNRNMESRHYNIPEVKDGDSVDIEHLMLPMSMWGTTDGLKDASKAYIDKFIYDRGYGIVPRTVYFDGNDNLPDIYPSLEGVTLGDLRAVMSPDAQYYPHIGDDAERVDEVVACTLPQDPGVEGGDDGTKYYQRDNMLISPLETLNLANNVATTFLLGTFSLGGGNAYTSLEKLSGVITEGSEQIQNLVVTMKISDGDDTLLIPAQTGQRENGWHIGIPTWLMKKGASGAITITVSVLASLRSTLTASVKLEWLISKMGTYPIATVNFIAGDFKMTTRQLGFNPMDQRGEFKVSMKTGKCAGREFIVTDAVYIPETERWQLGLSRSKDDSLDEYFPNENYPILPGDRFVFIDIVMPQIYISLAEERLYKAADKYYDENSIVKYSYTPEIDAIVMKDKGIAMLEGRYMKLADASIIGPDSIKVLIDTLTIDTTTMIPTYKVTLRDDKPVSFYNRLYRALDKKIKKTL